MKSQHPPKKKKVEKADQLPAPEGRIPVADSKSPRAEEGKDTSSNESPSEEEVIANWRKPVTNQDEQEKITNAGGDDIPLADN